jgi:hypothetical protein
VVRQPSFRGAPGAAAAADAAGVTRIPAGEVGAGLPVVVGGASEYVLLRVLDTTHQDCSTACSTQLKAPLLQLCDCWTRPCLIAALLACAAFISQARRSLRLRCTACGARCLVMPACCCCVDSGLPHCCLAACAAFLIEYSSGKEEFEAALHSLWRSLLGPGYPERLPACQPMAGQQVEPWALWREVWAWGGPDVISRNKVRVR